MADEDVREGRSTELDPEPWRRAKRLFVYATGGIALGLGIAGSLDPRAGGLVLLVAWLVAIAALHRLGRAGSAPRP